MSAPQYAPGTTVRVKRIFPSGHIRTPFYTRGHTGVIDACIGHDPNPEYLAYGRLDQPAEPVYRVRFRQTELWPDYTGRPEDTLIVDLFEHWLETAGHYVLRCGDHVRKGVGGNTASCFALTSPR